MQFCVTFGLCSAKDTALVRGNVKDQEKVQFLRSIIELVQLNESHAADQAGASQRLLADVISDSRAILSKQVSLFPADMDPIYSIKGPNVPTSDVEGAISNTKAKLREIEQKLASYDVSSITLSDDTVRTDIGALKNEVQGQFARLQSVMKQFEAVYALDIKPWCRDDADSSSGLLGLGPSATNLLSLQKNLQSALSNLKLFKTSYQQMTTNDPSVDVTYCDLGINEQSIIAVQEQCSILEKAILRRQEAGVI